MTLPPFVASGFSRTLSIVAVSAIAIGLSAQAPVGPAFEVASVKPNTSGAGSSGTRTGKGSVAATNVLPRNLIANAFGVRADRISGPSWIDSERFDVNARAAPDTPDSQLPLMMRTLLAERFKLLARREMRDQPIYALVLARPDGRLGPNLRPSTDCLKGGPGTPGGGGSAGAGGGGGLKIEPLPAGPVGCGMRMFSDNRGTVTQGGSTTLAAIAGALDGAAGRSVIDRTGLSGTFDVDLRYARSNAPAAAGDDNPLPTVFTALQEQLGLKLESATGPVEFLVVDSIERPTPD